MSDGTAVGLLAVTAMIVWGGVVWSRGRRKKRSPRKLGDAPPTHRPKKGK